MKTTLGYRVLQSREEENDYNVENQQGGIEFATKSSADTDLSSFNLNLSN